MTSKSQNTNNKTGDCKAIAGLRGFAPIGMMGLTVSYPLRSTKAALRFEY
jgi:hypothetical protein